jgi:very-short-patch-repair endonuclease
MKARELCKELEYSEFRHFDPVILRCLNLINNGLDKGVITPCTKEAEIGSGAIRIVKDYDLDNDAERLVRKMAVGFKMNGSYPIRNETALFSLLKKFCLLNSIEHEFQFKLGEFIYDFRYEKTLIEFDESHHATARQTKVDKAKNQVAVDNGYEILRFGFQHDIIDILQELYF